MTTAAALEMSQVRKSHSALRPLRIQSLSVAAGERVALTGIDAAGAEVLVNLITGASVPDEGDIRVFGVSTTAVTDGEAWLAALDRFGIVSERAVMLEGATVAENLALPFTLEIDPMSPETAATVGRLAAECDIAEPMLRERAGDVSPGVRARVRFARAVALDPRLLLMEHPTAALPEPERARFGEVVARVCGARALTALAVTLDLTFAAAAAHRTLTLQPATGQLVAARRSWWRRA